MNPKRSTRYDIIKIAKLRAKREVYVAKRKAVSYSHVNFHNQLTSQQKLYTPEGYNKIIQQGYYLESKEKLSFPDKKRSSS